MSGRLQNKIALITGASRGIGAACAKAFAREGAQVIITSRTQETLDKVAEDIHTQYPNTVWAKACHMGQVEEIQALLTWIQEQVGTPNVLVNNAATNPYFGPLLDTPEWAWEKTFDVNLKGYFYTSQHIGRALLAEQKPGSIINISSIVGLRGSPFQGVYAMTKSAIVSMTQTMAVELGPSGIRCNAIAPGLVDTQLAATIVNEPTLTKQFTDKTALKRHAQPEELTGLAVYLASDESSYVTGQTICVDGGYTTL